MMEETAVQAKISVVYTASKISVFAMRTVHTNVKVKLLAKIRNIILRVERLSPYYRTSGTCFRGNNLDCDGANNNPDCEFDDGDCCLEEPNCDFCFGLECICHIDGISHCPLNIGKSFFVLLY